MDQGAPGQRDLKKELIAKISTQAADLVNVAKLPPAVVATLYLDVAIALALHMGADPRLVATELRAHAAMLEAPDPMDGPAARA